jgi:hypothetical protein
MRSFCIGFIALLILTPLAAGAQSPLPPSAVDDDRGERDDRPPTEQKWHRSAGVLKRQVREQTVLRAFFERPEVSCFALNGLFKLGAGRVEFVYAVARVGVSNAGAGPRSSPDTVHVFTFSDRHCAIAVHVFKEVLRDGQRRRAGPPDMLEHAEWPPARPGVDIFDFPGDRIRVSGQAFPFDPDPTCILREGLFAITPSGLQLVFREPRYALPFEVDQYVLRDQRRAAIEFTTATCRLVLEVEKHVGEARLAPLE